MRRQVDEVHLFQRFELFLLGGALRAATSGSFSADTKNSTQAAFVTRIARKTKLSSATLCTIANHFPAAARFST
jgi:hypothetical protein